MKTGNKSPGKIRDFLYDWLHLGFLIRLIRRRQQGGERVKRAELDERIWELHVPLLRLALSILRHPQNAEDAVSAAVITAYQKLDTLRDDAALKPWLMRITARCCYDLLRRSKREVLYGEPLETGEALFIEPLENTLFGRLRQLPAGQAQVLLLYYYEGFSTAEIAQILGIPRPAVSMRMTRGRNRLREMLQEEELADAGSGI